MGEDKKPTIPSPHIFLPVLLELPRGDPVNGTQSPRKALVLPPPLQQQPEPSLPTLADEVFHSGGREKICKPSGGLTTGPIQDKRVQRRSLTQSKSYPKAPSLRRTPPARGPFGIPFVEPAGYPQPGQLLVKAEMGPFMLKHSGL
jgi:hypothetical protein